MSGTRPFNRLSITSEHVKGNPNEYVEMRNIFSTQEIVDLYNKVVGFPAVYGTPGNDLAKFKELGQQALKKFEREAYGSASTRVFTIRMICRLKYILQKVDRGIPFWEACLPYVLSPEGSFSGALDNAAFLKADQEIDEEFVKQSLAMLAKDRSFDQKEMLIYLVGRQAAALQVARYFLEHLLTPPKKKESWSYGSSASVDLLSLFLAVLPSISDSSWHAMIEVFLHDTNALQLLKSRNALEPFLNELAKRPNAGLIVQAQLAKTQWVASIDMAVFIPFMRQLSLPGDVSFTKFQLDPKRDYFKLLLMQGFDYKHCLQGIKSSIGEFPGEATAILYEALSQGDIGAARELKDASSAHVVDKERLTIRDKHKAPGFFEQKEVRHAEKATFGEKLSYSLQDLLKYITQKHRLATDKEALYFIAYPIEFAQKLFEFGIIQDKRDFLVQLSKAFGLDLKPEDIVRKDKEIITEDRIVTLESQMSQVLSENADLKQRLAKMEQMLFALMPGRAPEKPSQPEGREDSSEDSDSGMVLDGQSLHW